jgi:hypothetical protein
MKRLLLFFIFITLILSCYSLVATAFDQRKTFELEEMNYLSLEEAILTDYEQTDVLKVFQTGEKNEKLIYVVYTINEDQLMSELLSKTKSGFQRVKESRFIIGGTPLTTADYKLRTFLVTEGPWVEEKMQFTYVTFGVIQNPQKVNSVEIRYEGQYKKINMENNSFFNISSSNHQWDTLHPIIFYDENREDVGGVMRDLLASDAYCH